MWNLPRPRIEPESPALVGGFLTTRTPEKSLHQLAFNSLCCCCCSVTMPCLTLCDPMDCSMPGSFALHYLPKFAQIQVHWVGDTIKPSHPLSPSFPFAFNLSQHPMSNKILHSQEKMTLQLSQSVGKNQFFRVSWAALLSPGMTQQPSSPLWGIQGLPVWHLTPTGHFAVYSLRYLSGWRQNQLRTLGPKFCLLLPLVFTLPPVLPITGFSFGLILFYWTCFLLWYIAWWLRWYNNLLAIQETWVQSLVQEGPLEKTMAIHSNILAWRIPWTKEPGRLQSMGSQRVTHDWVTNKHTDTLVALVDSEQYGIFYEILLFIQQISLCTRHSARHGEAQGEGPECLKV